MLITHALVAQVANQGARSHVLLHSHLGQGWVVVLATEQAFLDPLTQVAAPELVLQLVFAVAQSLTMGIRIGSKARLGKQSCRQMEAQRIAAEYPFPGMAGHLIGPVRPR